MQNPTQLQSLAKCLKDKMNAGKTARRAAANAERLCLEACASKKVHQEGALGALPWTCGVDAPHVTRADEAFRCLNQDVCNLLAKNPSTQNNHAHPIAAIAPPTAAAAPSLPSLIRVRVITPPTDFANPAPLPTNVPKLPSLNALAVMVVPPPPAITGAGLPAAPDLGGTAKNSASAIALLCQCFAVDAAMVGVGQPIVVDEADAAAIRWTCFVDNMDDINSINCEMFKATKMIGNAISVRQMSLLCCHWHLH